MRALSLCFVLLVVALVMCSVYGSPADVEDVAVGLTAEQQSAVSLSDVDARGHENEGERLARQYGYRRGYGGGYRGGYGGGYRGGYGGGYRGGYHGGYHGYRRGYYG